MQRHQPPKQTRAGATGVCFNRSSWFDLRSVGDSKDVVSEMSADTFRKELVEQTVRHFHHHASSKPPAKLPWKNKASLTNNDANANPGNDNGQPWCVDDDGIVDDDGVDDDAMLRVVLL